MTFPYEDNNPWLVVRGDIELLEDEYHRLLDHGAEHEAERRALAQQKLIERRARHSLQVFEAAMGEGDDEDEDEALFEMDVTAEEDAELVSLRTLLVEATQGSRLYLEAVVWVKEIVEWARETSPSKKDPSGDLYALVLHASVVPIKMRFAEEEEDGEDIYAAELASLEYRLARDYLKATLDSLQLLSPLFPEAQPFFDRGGLLHEHLLKVERTREASRSFRFRHL